MLKIINKIYIFLSIAVFSQNTAIIEYRIKKPCYKFSIVRIGDLDDARFNTEKVNYPKQGKFEIKTDDEFPLPFLFVCETEKNFVKGSKLFTVNSGDRLKFDMDSIVDNKQYFPCNEKQTMLIQDQHQFYRGFPDTEMLYSSNDKTYRDNLIHYISLFEKYAEQNPNSHMLFWNLVKYFDENSWLTGFNWSYLKAFNNLSPAIRNSKYGKIFYKKMINASQIKEGSRFPHIKLEEGKDFSLGAKYTLVDFWASYCKPCLQAFPAHKDLYEQYKSRGFEIVGISGDRQLDIDKWKKVIHDKQLIWQQYIDIGGKESEKYNITAYPTTFLLDSEGIIIKKDISIEELKSFLKENLNAE